MTERDTLLATQQLLSEATNVVSPSVILWMDKLSILAAYSFNLQLEDLKRKDVLYESAQAELQALYSRVFDGPSEGKSHDMFLVYE